MNSKLPTRASLEYLKKLAKERLQELRREDPNATLAAAQLAVAQAHGFPSWRALKAEVEHRRASPAASFFKACERGDVETLRALLEQERSLVHERHAHHERTGLHIAATAGHVEAVRKLLEHDADPNARDGGDDAYALHFAAEAGHVETVRALLDAGGDVHGFGDVHKLDVIGWATCVRDEVPRQCVELLLERGARHHIFSAIAVGDVDLVQRLVEETPDFLNRRMSRFEQAQTPLHFAVVRKQHAIMDLLIELGADLESEDNKGRTPLALAILRGDDDAASRLRAAGAKEPKRIEKASFEVVTPILCVSDFKAALRYYQEQLGFKKRWEWGEPPCYGCVQRGEVAIFLCEGGQGHPGGWLFVDVENVDLLHEEFQASGAKIRQPPTNFPWGAREMNIEDLDGNRLRISGHPTGPDDGIPLVGE